MNTRVCTGIDRPSTAYWMMVEDRQHFLGHDLGRRQESAEPGDGEDDSAQTSQFMDGLSGGTWGRAANGRWQDLHCGHQFRQQLVEHAAQHVS